MMVFRGEGGVDVVQRRQPYRTASHHSQEKRPHTRWRFNVTRGTHVYMYIYIAIGADTASSHQVALWHDSVMC